MEWWIKYSIALLFYFSLPILFFFAIPLNYQALKKIKNDNKNNAIVLVLGDLSRSPRMLYHARSLANGGVFVYLCGYYGEDLPDFIINNSNIKIIYIPEIQRKKYSKLPYLIFAIFKVILQHFYLFSLLNKLNGADYLLVQNPPSIPVLGVVRLFNLFLSRNTKVFIDWHNFGYSILALKLGSYHPFVIIAKFYEYWFGTRAFAHFCVSISMGSKLMTYWKIPGKRIIPLYDRPTQNFKILSLDEKLIILQSNPLFKDFNKNDKIIITATSYTIDEDYDLLLNALDLYNTNKNLPNLFVIVTGKGPLKQQFEKKIKEKNSQYKNIKIKTAWLEPQLYPKIIACADLGVSLHTSSSGLDLPMKIVDMFGCGVPVVALDFPALKELVKNDINGFAVKSSQQMADTFIKIFSDSNVKNRITNGAHKESLNKWDENWNLKVGPLFGIGEYRIRSEDSESESSSDDD